MAWICALWTEGTELEEETTQPRDTFIASRIYMRAKPSPGYARKVRQAVRRPMPLTTDENRVVVLVGLYT
jgi:hypothetical protein